MTLSKFGAARWGMAAALGLAIAMPASAQEPAASESVVPTDLNILMWTQDQRDFAFRRMEELAPVHTISNGEMVRAQTSG